MTTFIKSPFECAQDRLLDTILLNESFVKKDKDYPNSLAKKWEVKLSLLVDICSDSVGWINYASTQLNRWKGEMCLYCLSGVKR